MLRGFLALFFGLALALIIATVWNKARACRAHCQSQGKPDWELGMRGGGRFASGVICRCGPHAPASE